MFLSSSAAPGWGRCWIRSLPRRRRVLVLDITQAAAEVSRLVHEAYDLNLSIGQPSVIDGDPSPEPAGHGKADQGHDPLPCSFGLVRSPRSGADAQRIDLHRVTVVDRWRPLVTLLWHAGGTASEANDGSYLAARISAHVMVEFRELGGRPRGAYLGT